MTTGAFYPCIIEMVRDRTQRVIRSRYDFPVREAFEIIEHDVSDVHAAAIEQGSKLAYAGDQLVFVGGVLTNVPDLVLGNRN